MTLTKKTPVAFFNPINMDKNLNLVVLFDKENNNASIRFATDLMTKKQAQRHLSNTPTSWSEAHKPHEALAGDCIAAISFTDQQLTDLHTQNSSDWLKTSISKGRSFTLSQLSGSNIPEHCTTDAIVEAIKNCGHSAAPQTLQLLLKQSMDRTIGDLEKLVPQLKLNDLKATINDIFITQNSSRPSDAFERLNQFKSDNAKTIKTTYGI